MITIHCENCGRKQHINKALLEMQAPSMMDKHFRHEINFVTGGIEINEVFIKLTPMEGVVLKLLFDAIPRIVNHEGILAHLYNGREPEYAITSVRVTIHNINYKLAQHAPKWRVHNEKGIGQALRRKV